MSFKAKLFMGGEERTILNASQIYQRFADVNGRPTSNPIGVPLEFSIESTRSDSFFYQNMFSPTMKCEGEIVFYRRDGFSTMFKIEFANAQIIGLGEHFSATGNQPLYMNIVIGWGIMRMRGVIYEQTWNPNNPFLKGAAPTVIDNEEPEIIGYHLEDLDGNEIRKEEINVGEEIMIVVESSNAVGETFELNLDDSKLDYEHNGIELENDTFDVHITEDIQYIPLKAILQKN